MHKYDIIIIGAGPAGLFCAINCAADRKLKVLLLEKNQSPGRKLLLSGNGSCNITHTGTVSEFIKHYGQGGDFVKPALNCFKPSAMMDFLHENNIPTVETDTGKIFPGSMNAGDVLSMLAALCSISGVILQKHCSVTGIKYVEGKFTAYAGKKIFMSPVLVIATGGCSYPGTGSTGDGYTFAKSLGHSIAGPAPALTPLFIRDFPFTRLSGLSVKNTHISLFRKNKKIISSTGDILFTHRGLSGPGILDMSRYVEKNDVVKISLTGDNAENMDKDFISASRSGGNRSIKNYLKSVNITERLIMEILVLQNIPPLKKTAEISRDERIKLFRSLGEFPFTVEDKGGFNIAMATTGGVSSEEINKFTMESKIVPGLYFAGEVIDIDGDTGGYNIQWAFSSGKLAAESIRRVYD
jgi:predicted Rossmann fold flavoprotein